MEGNLFDYLPYNNHPERLQSAKPIHPRLSEGHSDWDAKKFVSCQQLRVVGQLLYDVFEISSVPAFPRCGQSAEPARQRYINAACVREGVY